MISSYQKPDQCFCVKFIVLEIAPLLAKADWFHSFNLHTWLLDGKIFHFVSRSFAACCDQFGRLVWFVFSKIRRKKKMSADLLTTARFGFQQHSNKSRFNDHSNIWNSSGFYQNSTSSSSSSAKFYGNRMYDDGDHPKRFSRYQKSQSPRFIMRSSISDEMYTNSGPGVESKLYHPRKTLIDTFIERNDDYWVRKMILFLWLLQILTLKFWDDCATFT